MRKTDDRLRAIGLAIARERDKQGLSQIDLALRLGYTDHSYLSRIENGKASMSVTLLLNIAEALDLDVKHLFADL